MFFVLKSRAKHIKDLKGKKKKKALPENRAGQTAKYSGGLPVLADMEKEAKTPLSHVQDESLLLLPPLTLLHNSILYIELPFVSSPVFPSCFLLQAT